MKQNDNCIIAVAAELLLKQPRRSLKIDPRALTHHERIVFDTMDNYCRLTNQVRSELVSAASPDGVMVHAGECYIILYNESAPPSRRAFTLAHEVGHIYLCHKNDLPENERQANLFAAHLLLPRVLLWEYLRRCPADPAVVAKLFGVSVQVATVQIEALKTQPFFLEAEKKLLELSRSLLPNKNEPVFE